MQDKEQQEEKVGLLGVVKSVVAAMFGVQSDKTASGISGKPVWCLSAGRFGVCRTVCGGTYRSGVTGCAQLRQLNQFRGEQCQQFVDFIAPTAIAADSALHFHHVEMRPVIKASGQRSVMV